MDIVNYLLENHDHTFYLIGGISLLLELTVLGLSGPLLFFGIAAFITGILISLGVISGWEAEIFIQGVGTALITLMLWKPLKRFQNSGGGPDTSSDMIGLNVPAVTDITASAGKVRYSGLDWMARLDKSVTADSVKAEAMCTIVGTEGTVMLVKPQD